MKDLEIYQDTGDLIKALSELICQTSQEAIAARGQFNFVLSGGSSPKKLYEILASDDFKERIDWANTYFFFGDERFVPDKHAERNSLMAEKTLFEPLKIEELHIFKIDTTGTPEESAKKYADAIAGHFNNEKIIFDFILLGLGDDAHTASLFPETSVLREREVSVKSTFVKKVEMYRITMTAPLINQARHVAFLVFGEGKAEAVYHVLHDDEGSAQLYPAKIIKPENGCLYWFLDTEAFMVLEKTENKLTAKRK